MTGGVLIYDLVRQDRRSRGKGQPQHPGHWPARQGATGDPNFDALTKRGPVVPPHGTRIPINVSDMADYDQIAVTPGLLSKIGEFGVFDFDGIIFSNIYNAGASGFWRSCGKYYISDHRPLWMPLSLPRAL